MSEIICRVIDEYVSEPTGEEIVRCRNCKHSCEESICLLTGWVDKLVCYSDQWSTTSLMPSHTVEPDGFCAWGEKKRAV